MDKADKLDLKQSTRRPFKSRDLAFSREVNRQGQRNWAILTRYILSRRVVPVGVPLDLSTPTGMSCIGTYGENFKSDNVSKYHVLLVTFLLLWHEN